MSGRDGRRVLLAAATLAACVAAAITAETAGAAVRAHAVQYQGTGTITFSGAMTGTVHAQCRYVAPGQHPEGAIELYYGAAHGADRNVVRIDQVKVHAPYGHVNLATTRDYDTSVGLLDGDVWSAGWTPPHDGSGSATVGSAMTSGHFTATMKPIQGATAPLQVTASWSCHA